jgi:hypothetical protein
LWVLKELRCVELVFWIKGIFFQSLLIVFETQSKIVIWKNQVSQDLCFYVQNLMRKSKIVWDGTLQGNHWRFEIGFLWYFDRVGKCVFHRVLADISWKPKIDFW